MRRTSRATGALAIAACLLATSALARGDGGEEPRGPETFKATAEVEGGRLPGTHRMEITIHIQSTTPPEVGKQLAGLVASGGQPALQAVLDRYANGSVVFGALQYTLNLVVRVPTGRGHRYVIVTNRPFGVYEVNTDQDSLAYPFGVIEFEVDDFGDGEGTVFPRAQITISEDGTVGVNGYGEPGRLLDVERQ